MKLKIITGPEIKDDHTLIDAIISLDKENMLPLMETAGIVNFDWNMRLKGLFQSETVFIGLFDDSELCGYVEYTKDWNNYKNIYISSIQIKKDKQGTIIFPVLIKELVERLKTLSFENITSNVQRSNKKMISIFNKLGFLIDEKENIPTLHVSATRQVLFQEGIWLSKRYKKYKIQRGSLPEF